MASRAVIEVIEGTTVQRIDIPRAGLTVGRAPDNQLVLSAASVSAHHAELRWYGDDLMLIDLGSSYGTRRDGQVLERPTMLSDGDEIVFARAVVAHVALEGAGFGAPTSELRGGEGLVEAQSEGAAPLSVDLLGAAHALFQATSYEDLYQRLLLAAAERFHASRIALIEVERAAGRFRMLGLHKASATDPRPLADAGFVSRTLVEEALARGMAHYLEGTSAPPVKSVAMSGAHSAVAARICPRDGKSRVLYLDATIGDAPLGAGAAVALELFASHAALAFDSVAATLELARDRVRFEQLRRYFSPAVVEHLLAGGESFVDKPRMVDGTVLFADLVGYTALSRELAGEPERMFGLLNRWLDAGAHVAMAHGGTLDKFIGDCVMVIFGAPFPQQEPELMAVRCAVQMMRAIERVSQEVGRSLAITVGVNSGPMLAGSVGSRRRLEYTVLGDTVNVAARLQGAARPGEILVGAETHARVRHQVDFEDAGSFTPKNCNLVHAYRVMRLREHDARSLGTLPPASRTPARRL